MRRIVVIIECDFVHRRVVRQHTFDYDAGHVSLCGSMGRGRMLRVDVSKFRRRCVLALVAVVAAATSGLAFGVLLAPERKPAPVMIATAPVSVVKQDSDWLSERFWQRRRQERSRAGYGDWGAMFGLGPESSDSGTYRTVCVRMCDGYYFPISFSTTRANFAADASACASRCSAPSRLYVYPANGGSPETMTDVSGRPYRDLPKAFAYRAGYNESCQCRPDPWSEEARARHAMYATKEWQRNARRLARQEQRRARDLSHRAPQIPQPGQGFAPIAGFVPPAVIALPSGPGDRSQQMSLGVVRPPPVAAARASRPESVRRGQSDWRRRVLFGNGN